MYCAYSPRRAAFVGAAKCRTEHGRIKRYCQSRPMRLARLIQPTTYCFPSGVPELAFAGSEPLAGSSGCNELVFSSGAETQSPAHNLVPLTVPTSLHPSNGFGFGFTCMRGRLPTFGALPCAKEALLTRTAANPTSTFRIIGIPPR